MLGSYSLLSSLSFPPAPSFLSLTLPSSVPYRSAQLFTALRALASSPKTSHLIADVRGAGLMVGLEFNDSSDSICALSSKSDKPVPKNIHTRVQAKCYEAGLMLLTTSIYPVSWLSFEISTLDASF